MSDDRLTEEELARLEAQILFDYRPEDERYRKAVSGISNATGLRLIAAARKEVIWREALDEERRKFQQETLRTSEQAQLIDRMIRRLENEGCRADAVKACDKCLWLKDAKELREKPINASTETAEQLQGDEILGAGGAPLKGSPKSTDLASSEASGEPALSPPTEAAPMGMKAILDEQLHDKSRYLNPDNCPSPQADAGEEVLALLSEIERRIGPAPVGSILAELKALIERQAAELRDANDSAIHWSEAYENLLNRIGGMEDTNKNFFVERQEMQTQITSLSEECERYKEALEQIASCKSVFTGDVVSVARSALGSGK